MLVGVDDMDVFKGIELKLEVRPVVMQGQGKGRAGAYLDSEASFTHARMPTHVHNPDAIAGGGALAGAALYTQHRTCMHLRTHSRAHHAHAHHSRTQAVGHVLEQHPEWRGRLVLVQITNAARSSSREVQELQEYVTGLADRINQAYGSEGYAPIVLLTRPVPLYERAAYYSIADAAVVTATRDGMNLVPYEYVVCRQGATEVRGEATRHTCKPASAASYLMTAPPTKQRKRLLYCTHTPRTRPACPPCTHAHTHGCAHTACTFTHTHTHVHAAIRREAVVHAGRVGVCGLLAVAQRRHPVSARL